MSEIDSQLSDDVVTKNINYERLLDIDEETIIDTCSRRLAAASKVACEWVVRIPHAYPFNDKGIYRKDAIGFSRYQQALMELISDVGSIVFLDRDFDDVVHLKISPLTKAVVNCVKNWLLEMEKSGDEMASFLIQSEMNVYKITAGVEKVKFERELNNLSLLLRKCLMNRGLGEKVRSFKKNSKKCFEQVMRICSQAFERYSSILLIRLDWGYRWKVPDMRGTFKNSQDYEQRFRQVSHYREKMLKVLQKMYKKDLAFFVWKIECASVRGLHIHWFIGLNGAKHQDRINVPRAIADKWDEVLGLGKDVAYTRNINAHQKHESAILRVVDYHDPLLWKIIGGYADYLTKVDYLVRHRTPGRMHSFGSTKQVENLKKKKGPQRKKKMSDLDLRAVRCSLNEQFSVTVVKDAQ